jgi:hypothetical protein
MNPVEPRAQNLRPEWHRVVYAEHQPQISLPSLQEITEAHEPRPPYAKFPMAQRVVSVWEPDDTELAMMKACIESGGRPRISLMSHVHGQPLQPIRMTVGDFSDPYNRGLAPLDIVDDRTHAQKVADGDLPPGPPDPPKTKHRPVE